MEVFKKTTKLESEAFFSAYVTFTCIEATSSNPHKEFFYPALSPHPHMYRCGFPHPPRAGLYCAYNFETPYVSGSCLKFYLYPHVLQPHRVLYLL